MPAKTEILGPDEHREIDRMKRALALSQGAELHLIVGNTRRGVDEALRGVLPGVEPAHETVRHGESPRSFAGRWLSWIERAAQATDEEPVVLDAWDPDPDHEDHWSWVFSRLNERRNEIMRELARPLILVVSPDNERLLGKTAPDLWAIRGVGMRLRDRARLEAMTAAPEGAARDVTRGPAVPEPAASEDERREVTLGPETLPRAIEASRRARRLHGDGYRAVALESADEAVLGYEALVEGDEELRIDLARALSLRGDVQAALGRRANAVGDLGRAIKLLEVLRDEDPERADVQRELMDGYGKLGDLYLALQQPELAGRAHELSSELRASLGGRGSPRATAGDAPSVFISYSHDSAQHAEQVRELAERLRADGIDVRLDRDIAHPAVGWPMWVKRQTMETDFVVVVCTPAYRDRFEGTTLEVGHGVGYEQELLRELIYEKPQRRVIPVFFQDVGPEAVPNALLGHTFYRLPQDYDPLYRRITRQSALPPSIGRPWPSVLQQPPPARAVGTPVSMLLLSADPHGVLDLAREQRAIAAALEGRPYDLRVVHDATVADVVRELDDHRPSIVHFSGHGRHGGGLILADEEHARHLTSKQFTRLLEDALPDPPLLVVFATSHSTELAIEAARYASYSIGFEGSIRDHAASLFSSTFYERLASKSEPDVPRAFVLARLACISSGYEEVENARLYEPPGREVPGT